MAIFSGARYELTVSTDPVSLNPNLSQRRPGVVRQRNCRQCHSPISNRRLQPPPLDSRQLRRPTRFDLWITMNETHNVIANYELDTSPPSINNLQQNPPGQQMPPGQSVNIQVTATDSETGVKNVTLSYRTSLDNATWSGWTDSPMDKMALDTYNGKIPGFSSGTFVQYRVTAFDNANNPVTLPATLCFDYYTIPELSSLILGVLLLLIIPALMVLTKRKHSS